MSQGFAEPGAHLCAPNILFAAPCVETPFDYTGHAASATGGGFFGYRIQFGSMVYGIETDLNYKSASNSWTLSDTNSFAPRLSPDRSSRLGTARSAVAQAIL
jgi:hypothetical protein